MATLKKTTEKTTDGPKMMPGSQDGHYFPFARKGNVLLGVRLSAIKDGMYYGVGGTTYFAARLRSAPENGLFTDEDAKQKVVKLQPNPPNLWDAWPGVSWEKKSSERASTTVGIFVKGRFKGDGEEGLTTLLGEIGEGKLASKLTEYLFSIAPEFTVCRQKELKAWLDAQYEPIVASIMGSLEKQKELQTVMAATVGNFSMQAALLKQVYGKTKTEDDEPDEASEGGEPEESEIEPDEGDGKDD